ncbi:MAG: DUF4105 domain-containing protein [Pirellulaceae bacterium]
MTSCKSIVEITFWRHCVIVIACSILLAGCQSLQVNKPIDRVIPSNDRAWVADLARLPVIGVQDGMVTVRNFRNCQYVTETDFITDFHDKTFPLESIQSVDFIVVPFQKTPAIAHTMLSFGLSDGDYVCVSAEIRKEIGEDYSPMLGVSNQFELCYVVADERDLIRLRTKYRDAEVYIYPTVADAAKSQELFKHVSARINELAIRPEFYNTFTNNCTTNITRHVNAMKPNGIPASWRVLLPGFSPHYAYDLKLLDQTLPFEELKSLALVNDLAEQHFDDPDFSTKIRQRLERIGRQDNELDIRFE